MTKPNPDWIGAYFMPADHELMLTDEEAVKTVRTNLAPDWKEPSIWSDVFKWGFILVFFMFAFAGAYGIIRLLGRFV